MQAGEPRRAEGGRKEHIEPRWYLSLFMGRRTLRDLADDDDGTDTQ